MGAHDRLDPEPLRLHLLGPFRVAVGERPIADAAWRLRKAAAVVKLLALAPGGRLHRERTLDLLWPDDQPAAASHSLNQALYVARRALAAESPTSPFLRSQGAFLILAPPGRLWTDVNAFTAAAAAARRSRDPAAHHAALALYTGDLLPDDPYEDWASTRRDELRQTRLALLLAVADLHKARGEHAEAVAALEQVVASEPAHEEAHVALMRLHAGVGRRTQAARQYRRLEEALRRDLDAEPDPASQRLHRDILAGRFPVAGGAPTSPSPVASAGDDAATLAAPLALPVQLTTFVGRERELAEVMRLLDQRSASRLLTLTGPGGSGKTRLALQSVASLAAAGALPGGAIVIEFAGLADPARLPGAVAAALGVREEPGYSLTATLTHALRSRSLLLVLDNCEHLLDACAALADALQRGCPHLRLLATSREPLRLAGETVWPVPPLTLPPATTAGEQVLPASDLARYDAVALFLDRAAAVAPDFTLTAADAPLVARICERLDGLPLAIELAAAHMAALSPAQIAARLDDAFRLLAGGVRTALPRQRTLRAAIDWSHDLLDERERRLFRRLAVFAGGWTLAAAEAVCAGPGLAGDEVLALLGQLIDKSLVMMERAAGAAESHYRLLELVRQYAAERLRTAGEEDEFRRRHATYFLDLAETAAPGLTSGDRARWLARLTTAGADNLRAAFGWAGEHEPVFALRLAGALPWFWYFTGRPGEAREWFARALTWPDAPPALRARVLYGAGAVAWVLGDYPTARALLDESVARWREVAAAPAAAIGLAHALTLCGLMTALAGEWAAAATLQEESHTLFRRAGDHWGLALALYWRGEALRLARDHIGAAARYAESLALFRATDDQWGIALPLQGLGVIAHRNGDHGAARAWLEEALAIRRRAGDRWLVAQSLHSLGAVLHTQGDAAQAAAHFAESLALYQALGDRQGTSVALHSLAACVRQSDQARSITLYRQGLALACDLGHRRRMAECLEALAAVDDDPARVARFLAAATAMRAANPSLPPDVAATLAEAAGDAWG